MALELYATGNSDAMYFAAMIADKTVMKKVDIQRWAKEAYWYYLSEHAVPSVVAKQNEGFEIALKWIDKKEENYTSAGWATLSIILSQKTNNELDLPVIKRLLKRAEKEVHNSSNRTRYTMNNFIISVGAYIFLS